MKKLIGFILRLAIIAALVVWLADQPGTARIVWHDYVIETSAAFLAVAAVAFGFACYLLFRLWHLLRHGPTLWKQRRQIKALNDGQDHLTLGLGAIAAGDASEAGKHAVMARRKLGVTTATQLLQAQAAQLAGDTRAAQDMFRALTLRDDGVVLGYRGLIAEARRANDRAEVERLVEELHHRCPETPWLGLMRFESLARQHRWDEADDVLKSNMVKRLLPLALAKRHHAAILAAASENAMRHGEEDKALQYAEQAMRQSPDWLPAVLALASAQMDAGHRRAAVRLIEKNWVRMPHPQLAALLRESENDPTEACRQIEKLCRDNADAPTSHLVIAEAAFAADIWGEARHHLMTLINSSAATQGVYRLMAKLERRERGDEAASQQWLIRAADVPADPTWLCDTCGGTHKKWQATCAHCGSFDTLEWQTPGTSRRIHPHAAMREIVSD
jgi:HemY protein